MRVARRLICLVLLSLTPSSAWGDIRFEDVSQSAGIRKHSPTAASAWGDINNDGWPDLWVSNHLGSPPSLYLNQQNGVFIDVADQVLPDDARADFHGAAWADVDNDGDQDLIVLTGAGAGRGLVPNSLFVNVDGAFINKAKDFGLDYPLGRGRTPLWMDANQDGKLDLLLMNQPRAEAPPAIFLQNSTGFVERNHQFRFRHTPWSRIERILVRFYRLTRFRFPAAARSLTVYDAFAQLADLSGNGALELVAYMQPTRLFSVNATRFREMTHDVVFPSTSLVQDAAIEDFNNDGQLDWYLARSNRPLDVIQVTPVRLQGKLVSGKPEQSRTVRFRTEGDVSFGIYKPWMDSTDPARETNPPLFIGSKRLELTDPIITVSPHDPTLREPPPAIIENDKHISIAFEPSSNVWTLKSSVYHINFVITATQPIDSLQTQGFKRSNGALVDRLMMRDNDQFIPRSLEPEDDPTASVSVAAGDFDNDMDIDLYLVCTGPTANLPNILYENDGKGHFVKIPQAGGAEGSRRGRGNQAATADFDRDGFLDLFVTNGLGSPPFANEGPHQLFRNRGNANHWLQIDLQGVVSNRNGIGAKLILETDGIVQIRQQDGGMHSFSQDHARIHFGLGLHRNVDRLTIFWPSGTVQHLQDIQTNQILVVKEPL